MKKKFILVNDSILDFEVYREDFDVLAAAFKSDLFEVATKYGFSILKIGKHKDLKKRTVFHNRHLDIELSVVLKKRGKLEFV
ncbi:hypothetical protein HYU18_03545 [Candidatus Woesearchaeota archaeon]|nr:hypothetical protein [Candidatus Woesearchaeota archaeon]